MHKNKTFVGAAMLLALVVTALPALGAEGRIPIWEPTTIAADGKYFLSRNIVTPAGTGAAIKVAAAVSHVDIDLNGFTIFGDPAGAPVIDIVGPRQSVTIRNGEVRNLGPFGDCIHIWGGGPGSLVQKVVIEDVKTSDGDSGIHLEEVLSFALRRNMVSEAGGVGIFATGFGLPGVKFTGTIEDNVVRSTAANAIHVEAGHSSIAIKNNRVERAGDFGIFVAGGEGFIIAENTVEETGSHGIYCEASNNSKIYNNSVAVAGGDGIHLVALGGFLILDNVSSFNMGTGLFIDGFVNHVDRNVLNFNGGCGLHFAPGAADNTYGRNTARLNGAAGGCACAFVPPVEPCAAIGGGGSSFPPDFCNENVPAGLGNTSFCDNLMPGPPRS